MPNDQINDDPFLTIVPPLSEPVLVETPEVLKEKITSQITKLVSEAKGIKLNPEGIYVDLPGSVGRYALQPLLRTGADAIRLARDTSGRAEGKPDRVFIPREQLSTELRTLNFDYHSAKSDVAKLPTATPADEARATPVAAAQPPAQPSNPAEPKITYPRRIGPLYFETEADYNAMIERGYRRAAERQVAASSTPATPKPNPLTINVLFRSAQPDSERGVYRTSDNFPLTEQAAREWQQQLREAGVKGAKLVGKGESFGIEYPADEHARLLGKSPLVQAPARAEPVEVGNVVSSPPSKPIDAPPPETNAPVAPARATASAAQFPPSVSHTATINGIQVQITASPDLANQPALAAATAQAARALPTSFQIPPSDINVTRAAPVEVGLTIAPPLGETPPAAAAPARTDQPGIDRYRVRHSKPVDGDHTRVASQAASPKRAESFQRQLSNFGISSQYETVGDKARVVYSADDHARLMSDLKLTPPPARTSTPVTPSAQPATGQSGQPPAAQSSATQSSAPSSPPQLGPQPTSAPASGAPAEQNAWYRAGAYVRSYVPADLGKANSRLGVFSLGINLTDAVLKGDRDKFALTATTAAGLNVGMKATTVFLGARAVPVVGQLVGGGFAGYDAVTSFQNGNYGRATLAGVETGLYGVAITNFYNPIGWAAGASAVGITAGKAIYDNWNTITRWANSLSTLASVTPRTFSRGAPASTGPELSTRQRGGPLLQLDGSPAPATADAPSALVGTVPLPGIIVTPPVLPTTTVVQPSAPAAMASPEAPPAATAPSAAQPPAIPPPVTTRPSPAFPPAPQTLDGRPVVQRPSVVAPAAQAPAVTAAVVPPEAQPSAPAAPAATERQPTANTPRERQHHSRREGHLRMRVEGGPHDRHDHAHGQGTHVENGIKRNTDGSYVEGTKIKGYSAEQNARAIERSHERAASRAAEKRGNVFGMNGGG